MLRLWWGWNRSQRRSFLCCLPPDVLVPSPEDVTDLYHVASPEALAQQQVALAGKKGAALVAVATEDGTRARKYPLDAPPTWDGLSAADGRLFVATTDGKVVCFGKEAAGGRE